MEWKYFLKILSKQYLVSFYFLILILLSIGLISIISFEKLDLNLYFTFLAFSLSLAVITHIYSESKNFTSSHSLVFFNISKNFLFITLIFFISILAYKLYLLKITIFYFEKVVYWLTFLTFSIALLGFLHNFCRLIYIIFKDLEIIKQIFLNLRFKK